ncbi:MAG TPA: hypothetical protein DEP66_02710 [Acidimicrobiaceae bacterium]|nr:hypothetical protein [Acidimicrobiaceae bacterium]HCB37134.1 hypothetical protein [Acidimicrobiaceae bacterium]
MSDTDDDELLVQATRHLVAAAELLARHGERGRVGRLRYRGGVAVAAVESVLAAVRSVTALVEARQPMHKRTEHLVEHLAPSPEAVHRLIAMPDAVVGLQHLVDDLAAAVESLTLDVAALQRGHETTAERLDRLERRGPDAGPAAGPDGRAAAGPAE